MSWWWMTPQSSEKSFAVFLKARTFGFPKLQMHAQALAACSISMPDAILVDVDMPTLDGHEFLRQLRRTQGGNRPKVVICLNENDVAQIARAMHAGADDFMMKPFDADHVRSKFKFVSAPHEPGEAAIPLRVNRQ